MAVESIGVHVPDWRRSSATGSGPTASSGRCTRSTSARCPSSSSRSCPRASPARSCGRRTEAQVVELVKLAPARGPQARSARLGDLAATAACCRRGRRRRRHVRHGTRSLGRRRAHDRRACRPAPSGSTSTRDRQAGPRRCGSTRRRYPSSSVAGWLAQGGAGFGSYEYGTFKENVVSARVVLPDRRGPRVRRRRARSTTSPTPRASPASSPRSSSASARSRPRCTG